MGSSRLPGKTLADVKGHSVLALMLGRMKRASLLDELVVATTVHPRDERVAEAARACGVRVVRGSEHDVLHRYVDAARATGARTIVRLTADCPLLDPAVVDLLTAHFLAQDPAADLVTNAPPVGRTYPDGMDVEVLSRDTLERLATTVTSAMHREHPTSALYAGESDVRTVHLDRDLGDVRITVDDQDDLDRVRRVVARFDHDRFTLDDVIGALEVGPCGC